MNLRSPIFFSVLLVALFVGAAFFPSISSGDKEKVLMQTILNGLDQLHYSPADINDDLSESVYDLYLDRIDGRRRWLTQEDLKQLKPHRLKLDDQAKSSEFIFLDKSIELLEAGLDKTEVYYKELLSKPFDYTKDETVELVGDDKPFAKDDTELKEYWRKTLKYDAMSRLLDKLEAQEEGGDEEVEKKSFEELEKEAREAVLETFDKWYVRMRKNRRSDHLSNYLNAFTNVFDPHTGYFEPKDKANFDINMSGTLEGIGARLQTEGEFTKVTSIVPGGPAWKQKQLEPKDLIMAVSQGNEDPVDVTGYRIDDVVKLIRGKKGTVVRLTVKKVDGSTMIVPITRDVVQMEEGYAKSLILDYPGKAENIGYIKLPRFYADFQRRGGRNCSTDMKAEIEKLNEQNVNGIIIDLRNNGGGSLRDVVKISGLFFEEGPVVQIKARGSRPEVLEDSNPAVQYDGPLIVMVNSFSASASEILAAALQDYKRAIIVGNTTFGKGTVQRFYDLDRALRGNDEVKPLGEVKLTIQKFYRVNGGSTQLKGVTPDIIMPDNYQYITTGEQENEHPMEWTEIKPVEYSQNVTKIDNMKKIIAASEKRIAGNEIFQTVDKNAKRLKKRRDKTTYTLNLDAYRAEQERLEAEAEEYEDLFKEIPNLAATNLSVDIPSIQSDSTNIARNDEWIKNVKKDAYLEETLSIMRDMINN